MVPTIPTLVRDKERRIFFLSTLLAVLSVCACVFRNLALSGPGLRDTARLSQRYPPIARYGLFGVST